MLWQPFRNQKSKIFTTFVKMTVHNKCNEAVQSYLERTYVKRARGQVAKQIMPTVSTNNLTYSNARTLSSNLQRLVFRVSSNFYYRFYSSFFHANVKLNYFNVSSSMVINCRMILLEGSLKNERASHYRPIASSSRTLLTLAKGISHRSGSP